MARLARYLRNALGFCLLALGTTSTGSAQAAVWMVTGANLTSGTRALKAKTSGVFSTTVSLDTKIGGNEVEFRCSTGELIGTSIEKEGRITTGGKGRWGGCITLINGTQNNSCQPNNNGSEPGVIVGNAAKGKLTEHSSGEGILVYESTVEEVIGGVKQPVFSRIKMSEMCPIGEDVPIIGPKVGIQDQDGMGATTFFNGLLHEEGGHEINEGALTEIWALSKTAEHKAKLLGEMIVELVSGETWSGLLP